MWKEGLDELRCLEFCEGIFFFVICIYYLSCGRYVVGLLYFYYFLLEMMGN